MHLDGVFTPVVTPFAADGTIDYAAYARLIDFQVSGGVAGLIPAGTTGEYYAMRGPERRELFEQAMRLTAGRTQLIAGCNAGATRDAIAYAEAARDLGYDGLMLAVPYTSLPTPRELTAHFRAVAEASGLPTVIYNFPLRAGVEIAFETLDALADCELIVGMKESSGDFTRFLLLQQRYSDRYQICCGSDDQALDYFFWGVTSWIAGTANVLPRHHVVLLDLARRGEWEEARRVWVEMLPWVQDMESGGYNQKAKLGIEAQGIPTGPVRQPLLPLTDDDVAAWRPVFERALHASLPSATAAD